jgi:hypothetical protein
VALTGDFGDTGEFAVNGLTGDFGETGDFAVSGDWGVTGLFAVWALTGVFAVWAVGAVFAVFAVGAVLAVSVVTPCDGSEVAVGPVTVGAETAGVGLSVGRWVSAQAKPPMAERPMTPVTAQSAVRLVFMMVPPETRCSEKEIRPR